MEVSVLLTDNRHLHELNKQYRGIDGPTDVLSFSQFEEENAHGGAKGILGDVVISVERAIRQAEEWKKDPQDELDLLVSHGLLHLLGYDDETPAGAEEMRRKVAAVLGDAIAR